jgi:hypothetical protein
VKAIVGALAGVDGLRATVQPCQTVASSHQHLTFPTGTCHIEHKHLIFLDLGALTGRRLKLSGCLRCRVAAPCSTPRNSPLKPGKSSLRPDDRMTIIVIGFTTHSESTTARTFRCHCSSWYESLCFNVGTSDTFSFLAVPCLSRSFGVFFLPY